MLVCSSAVGDFVIRHGQGVACVRVTGQLK
jgi:hypothetical protein